jgi:hypothetical protein
VQSCILAEDDDFDPMEFIPFACPRLPPLI